MGALALLSPREREIVKLIAAGHTNKEISAQLGMAVNTVTGTLSKIFLKTGTRRRSQLVQWVYRQRRQKAG